MRRLASASQIEVAPQARERSGARSAEKEVGKVPTIKAYPQGGTISMGGNLQAVPPDRTGTAISGWTAGAAARNTEFLWSVDAPALEPGALAATLTVKKCPPSAAEWKRAREALFFWLRRQGLVRLHWVTEWQRRRVPHLHMALWFVPWSEVSGADVVSKWLELTAQWGSTRAGQHVAVLYDASGWAKYVSKHAARGAKHYQRSRAQLPKSWQSGTGRMWGYLGHWPRVEPWIFDLQTDPATFHRVRRLYRGFFVGQARRRSPGGSSRAVAFARRCLFCPIRSLSPNKGMSGWIPREFQVAAMRWLHG